MFFDESSMSKASSPKQGGISESAPPDTLTVLRHSQLQCLDQDHDLNLRSDESTNKKTGVLGLVYPLGPHWVSGGPQNISSRHAPETAFLKLSELRAAVLRALLAANVARPKLTLVRAPFFFNCASSLTQIPTVLQVLHQLPSGGLASDPIMWTPGLNSILTLRCPKTKKDKKKPLR